MAHVMRLCLLVNSIKKTDATKLQDEYAKLVAGLQEANDGREEDDMLANPGMPAVIDAVRARSAS